MIGPGTGTSTFGAGMFGTGEDADTITNLGFELGSNGIAFRWQMANFTASALVPAELAFGGVIEGFERGWRNDNFVYSFTDDALTPGIVEDFSIGWANTGYLFTTFGAAVAPLAPRTLGAPPPPGETFEFGWDQNEIFKWAFPLGSSPYPYEITDDGIGVTDFGDNFIVVLNSGNLAQPSLSATRALHYESFDFVRFPANYTVNTGNDYIITTSHGLAVGQRVIFAAAPSGGTLPTPLASGVDYYVSSVVDANTFQVALSSGGGAVDITAVGIGPLTWTAPYEYWSTPGTTL